jgi:hypothetical protein
VPTAASAIYLDSGHTNAFVSACFRERLIRAFNDGHSDYERKFLANSDHPDRLQSALQMLVLYGEVILDPSFDNFVVADLASDAVRQAESRLRTDIDMAFPVDPTEFRAKGLQYPTAALLNTRQVHASLSEIEAVLDRAEEYSAARDYAFQMGVVKMMDATFGGRTPEQVRSINAKLHLADRMRDDLRVAMEAIAEVHELVHASEPYDAPVLWDCSGGHRDDVFPEGMADDLVVTHLFFQGLDQIVLDTVEDALELRRDDNIAEFRSMVFDMISALERGELGPREIQRRVERANRIAAGVRRVEGKGRLMSIVALPAKLVPLLSGAIEVLGFGTSVAAHRWRWALVGNADRQRLKRF